MGKITATRKPVTIECIQLILTKEVKCKYGIAREYNTDEIASFMGKPLHCPTIPNGTPDGEFAVEVETPNGITNAYVGDYIIKGGNGEFYPCKPDIFLKTYDIHGD